MRRATIRTVHASPAVVAAALEPDNTPEMSTGVEVGRTDDAGEPDGTPSVDEAEGGTAPRGVVETEIRRETTAGLRSTVDDYVSNLQVAQRVVNDGHDTNP